MCKSDIQVKTFLHINGLGNLALQSKYLTDFFLKIIKMYFQEMQLGRNSVALMV